MVWQYGAVAGGAGRSVTALAVIVTEVTQAGMCSCSSTDDDGSYSGGGSGGSDDVNSCGCGSGSNGSGGSGGRRGVLQLLESWCG